jgi:hypothetical protein
MHPFSGGGDELSKPGSPTTEVAAQLSDTHLGLHGRSSSFSQGSSEVPLSPVVRGLSFQRFYSENDITHTHNHTQSFQEQSSGISMNQTWRCACVYAY